MTNFYIIADLHGSWKPIRDFVARTPQLYKQDNILIILGDSGFNYFGNERDIELKQKLIKYPFTYLVIRGNHDERIVNVVAEAQNPSDWRIETFCGNMVHVEKQFPQIKYTQDRAALYQIAGQTTLVIPGAYSVDKYYRLHMGWNWFPGEQLTALEMEECEEKILEEQLNWKCDMVLSHTCPIHFEPTDLFIPSVDQSTVEKTMERFLGQIERKLDYKLWMWGHFHAYREYDLTDRHAIMLDAGQTVIDLNAYLDNKEYVV